MGSIVGLTFAPVDFREMGKPYETVKREGNQPKEKKASQASEKKRDIDSKKKREEAPEKKRGKALEIPSERGEG